MRKGSSLHRLLSASLATTLVLGLNVGLAYATENTEGGGVEAQVTDIDLAGVDWSVNIGDDCSFAFDGIFDGKGHTIYNLTSTETASKGDGYFRTGLFGAICGSAAIKNLTVENVTINTGDDVGNNAAAVVGFACNCAGSVENVHVSGDIKINAENITGTGVIVGYDYYGNLAVVDCSVKGSDGVFIIGAVYVGGVIGYASTNSNISSNIVENIDITATSCAAGGIAGIMLADGKAENNVVKNVALTAKHANWKNSAAAVVGTIAVAEDCWSMHCGWRHSRPLSSLKPN